MENKEIQTKRERKIGDLFTGRRKNSIARVKLSNGTGKVTINKKPMEEFFGRKYYHTVVKEPLKVLNLENEYDISVNVKGGGVTGQAEAIQLGVARCLDSISENYHTPLRKAGLLTRDPRMVERKKFGLHKARRATQFSKR